MTKTQTIDNILSLFCGVDDLWPALRQPNRAGDKTYASDGRVLLIIPNGLLGGEYTCHDRVPNFSQVIGQLKPHEVFEMDILRLREALAKIKKVPDTEPCEACDGEGQCPHCGRECKTCDGKGEMDSDTLPYVFPRNLAAIKVDEGYCFAPYYLDLVERLMTTLHANTAYCESRSTAMMLFRIGEVEVLLCKLSYSAHEDIDKVIDL